MKENDYFFCLMCRKMLINAMERKQHLRYHRERNETCAIRDSNRKTIIYYKRGYLQDVCREVDTTLRDKIINEVKGLKAEPLMQKAPTAIEFVEDNYPEVVDYLSTEGRIAGLLLVLELLDEEDSTNTDTDQGNDVHNRH